MTERTESNEVPESILARVQRVINTAKACEAAGRMAGTSAARTVDLGVSKVGTGRAGEISA